MSRVATKHGETTMIYPVMSWQELKDWEDDINASDHYDPSDRMQFEIEMTAYHQHCDLYRHDTDTDDDFLLECDSRPLQEWLEDLEEV